MKVRELMTTAVATVSARDDICAAAQAMRAQDVGMVVVTRDTRPVGVITDRDIALATSGGDGVTCGAIMTAALRTCHPDDSIEAVAARMGDLQLRRLVVLDDAGLLVGVVSLGDIARDACEHLAGETLGEVVEKR